MAKRKIWANGVFVRDERNRKGLSQLAFAHECKISLRVLTDFETKNEATAETIARVARKLGVDAAFLTTRPAGLQERVMELARQTGFADRLRRELGKDSTFLVIVFGGGSLALLLACTGFFPINALPLYLAGLCLSALALGVAALNRRGYVFAGSAAVACIVATYTWPNVFGIFSDAGGRRIGFGTRQEYATKSNAEHLGLLQVHVDGMHNLFPYEPVTWTIIPSTGVPISDGNFPNTLFATASYYRLEPGKTYTVVFEVGLREIARKDVYVPADTSEPAECKFVIPRHERPNAAFFGFMNHPDGPYDVLVDGVKVGVIDRPGRTFFKSTPGMHEFSLVGAKGHYRVRQLLIRAGDTSSGFTGDKNWISISTQDGP